MKRSMVVLVLMAVAIVAIFSVVNAAECNCQDEIYKDTHYYAVSDKAVKSFSLVVVIKGEKGPLLGGEKIITPLGQYIVGKDGNLVNVTGFTLDNMFVAGLISYGLPKKASLKRAIRCIINETTTVYVFDYK